MLYFYDTCEEVQKLATYAPNSFQNPHTSWQGALPWTSLGHSPQTSPAYSSKPAIPPPNLRSHYRLL